MSNNFGSIWSILAATGLSDQEIRNEVIEQRFQRLAFTGPEIAESLNRMAEAFPPKDKSRHGNVSVTRAKEWRRAGYPVPADMEED